MRKHSRRVTKKTLRLISNGRSVYEGARLQPIGALFCVVFILFVLFRCCLFCFLLFCCVFCFVFFVCSLLFVCLFVCLLVCLFVGLVVLVVVADAAVVAVGRGGGGSGHSVFGPVFFAMIQKTSKEQNRAPLQCFVRAFSSLHWSAQRF